MRTRFPRQRGDQRIFREDFLNLARVIDNNGEAVGAPLIDRGLTVGQVRYYSAAQSISYAGAVSIASHVIVSSTGANQALWSIGTGASRRMEVGIDGAGRPYAWGTSQVLLGTAVSDGHHDLGFSVGTDGSVWCVVDGEIWGSGTVTFGATFDRMIVGGSCLGGLAWAGAVKDVDAYRGQMNEAQMAHAMGASVGFQMESLAQPGNKWLLTDLDGAGGVTTQPQASPPNGDFETGDTTGFTSTGGAVSVAAGAPGGTGSWVGRHDGLASSRGRFNGSLVTGNRTLARFWVRAGQSCYVGDGVQLDRFYSGTPAAWTFVSAEGTTGATDLLLWQVADGWIEVDNVTTKNLSINAINCKGNLGNLVQATAENMPWSSDADAPTSVRVNGKRVVYGDGTDNLTTSATDFLHDGTGGTLCALVSTGAATSYAVFNAAAAAEIGIRIPITGVVAVTVCNGTGVNALATPNRALAAGLNLIIWRLDAAKYSLRVNAVETDSGGALALSALTSTRKQWNPSTGGYGNRFVINRYITDAECLKVEKRLRAYYGIQ